MHAYVLVPLLTAPLLGPFSSVWRAGTRWISNGDKLPQCNLQGCCDTGEASRYQRSGRAWDWALIPSWHSRPWHLFRLWDKDFSVCKWIFCLESTSRHTPPHHLSCLFSMALSFLKASKPPLCSHYTIHSLLIFPRASRTRTECEERLEMIGKVVLCCRSPQ